MMKQPKEGETWWVCLEQDWITCEVYDWTTCEVYKVTSTHIYVDFHSRFCQYGRPVRSDIIPIEHFLKAYEHAPDGHWSRKYDKPDVDYKEVGIALIMAASYQEGFEKGWSHSVYELYIALDWRNK